MTASFATYASQFLTRQQNAGSNLTSSQPMFFSFTTDNESLNGHNPDTDLDDLDDPHLRDTGPNRSSRTNNDDDDPYLRLDEDEQMQRRGFDSRAAGDRQATPLISPAFGYGSDRSESPKGWLAHQTSPLHRSNSSSPSPPASESSDSDPPPDLLQHTTKRPSNPSTRSPKIPPPPTTTRNPASLSLTESLLPRDGTVRPIDVFTLPDPRHTPRGRRKYHDSIWTALWCAGVTVCYVSSILLLFLARQPASVPRERLPYTTLLHTVPMLTILTFLSALVAYTHIFLLNIFVKPVTVATSVFIPATLLISAIWAFVGSFMWEKGETEPTWGETVGLRLFSLIPLTLAIITGRRLMHLPRTLHTTSTTLKLTTHLLIAQPFLLALSPAILLATLIGSLPIVTLIFRLLLMGYGIKPHAGSSRWEWHVYAWANWSIAGAAIIWLWSWGVSRGILRMTTSSVIGAWYFADPDVLPPPPTSTHTIHAALTRSTGPSLGSIALSALILTLLRVITLVTILLQRLPAYLPVRLVFIASGLRTAAVMLEGVGVTLSGYALVYAGLTGDPFVPSAKRARELTNAMMRPTGRGIRGRSFGAEPPLMLLTVAPLTLTFPFALMTYLFVAHTLDAPNQALGAALLAGCVTALVGLFCVGLVKDTADTLYICYCIDKAEGERRREEVFVAFEYGSQPPPSGPSRQQQTPSHGRAAQGPPGAGPSRALPQSHPEQIEVLHPSRKPPPPTQKSPMGPIASASQRLPLARPPPPPPTVPETTIEDEDLDPFSKSVVHDDEVVLAPSPPVKARRSPTSVSSNSSPRGRASPLPTGILGHTRLRSDDGAGASSRTHSRAGSASGIASLSQALAIVGVGVGAGTGPLSGRAREGSIGQQMQLQQLQQQGQRQRVQPQQIGEKGATRMMTSRELNMKRPPSNAVGPYEVSSPSPSESSSSLPPQGLEGLQDIRSEDGSQMFPGSGLFS